MIGNRLTELRKQRNAISNGSLESIHRHDYNLAFFNCCQRRAFDGFFGSNRALFVFPFVPQSFLCQFDVCHYGIDMRRFGIFDVACDVDCFLRHVQKS